MSRGGQQYQGALSINKSLTLHGDPGDESVPGADAAAPELVRTAADGDLVTIAASGVTIDGFLLNAQVAGGALDDSDNGITGSGSDVTLHNNTFTGFDADGIAMTSSDNLDVHHNLFMDIGLDAIGVTGGTDVTITHNLVHGSGATVGAGRDGISVASSPGVVIDNNWIEGVLGGTGAVNDGVLLQSSDNAVVTNNTVFTGAAEGSVGAGHLAFEILTSANVTFTNNVAIDTTPPNTTITANPPALANTTSASFSFTSTEAGSTFACALDSGAFAACTSPKTYAKLKAGSHTFRVRARDVAGNTDPTPATYTWTIDTTAPKTSIVSGPKGTIIVTSATFTWTGTDNVTPTPSLVYAYRLDPIEASFSVFGSATTASYSSLPMGSYTFYVKARDQAGNETAKPATRKFTVQ